jgi:hypothetical protein
MPPPFIYAITIGAMGNLSLPSDSDSEEQVVRMATLVAKS